MNFVDKYTFNDIRSLTFAANLCYVFSLVLLSFNDQLNFAFGWVFFSSGMILMLIRIIKPFYIHYYDRDKPINDVFLDMVIMLSGMFSSSIRYNATITNK